MKGSEIKGVSEEPFQFQVSTEEESYNLEALILRVGDDWLVSIWGGRRPHIGAIAVAQPRPSLKDKDLTSATASIFCFLGHKEDLLVKEASERLAASLKANVVMTAGIHWDDIDSEGIRKVMENSRILIDMINEKICQTERL